MTTVKILVIGPTKCGKTKISNYLADIKDAALPDELCATKGVRILEFEVPNLKVEDDIIEADVQLWDSSGDEKYLSCWPAIRRNANGIVFVYIENDPVSARQLDLFYKNFVSQTGFPPRNCIVFSHRLENDEIQTSVVKLSSLFSKMSQSSVNLETTGEKLRADFNQFLITVLSGMKNK